MTIRWFRPVGNVTRGMATRDGKAVYVVLTRYVFGWRWSVETNYGREIGATKVYFVDRAAAEKDVTKWMSKEKVNK